MDDIHAVARAKALVEEMFGDDAASPPSLEGIVLNGDFWDVTLSFKRSRPLSVGGLAAFNVAPHLNNYQKLFRLKKSDGALLLIKDAVEAS
jgi:hypothetical protein